VYATSHYMRGVYTSVTVVATIKPLQSLDLKSHVAVSEVVEPPPKTRSSKKKKVLSGFLKKLWAVLLRSACDEHGYGGMY